jgi:hypothetical protein
MDRRHVPAGLRRGVLCAGSVALALGGLLCAGSAGHAAPAARTASALDVNDTGHLHLLHASGTLLVEEGPSTGTLPGTVKVRMTVGASVAATFTIASRAGSIEGRGSATLHNSSRYASFDGTLSVSHGTGRYAHAHGSGKLYGVIDRRTHALIVQTIGTLDY